MEYISHLLTGFSKTAIEIDTMKERQNPISSQSVGHLVGVEKVNDGFVFQDTSGFLRQGIIISEEIDFKGINEVCRTHHDEIKP